MSDEKQPEEETNKEVLSAFDSWLEERTLTKYYADANVFEKMQIETSFNIVLIGSIVANNKVA